MSVRAVVLAGLGTLVAGVYPAASQTLVPTRYIADRFFGTPVTTQGDTLLLLIDSGGGGVWVIKPVLERLGFKPKFTQMEEGDSSFTDGKFPKFKPGASIPVPLGVPDSAMGGFGTVPIKWMNGAVGMLGHTWFAGRVWVFDYPKQQLSYYEKPPQARPFGPHTIPMTLKRPLSRNDPRIQVIVAGDTVDMLLDTGATSEVSPEMVKLLGGGPSTRASAFVATRLWDRWRSKHPDWRVVSKGEIMTQADMIEVPVVTIGGYDVGPVWFAKRRDSVYDGMMKALMDKPILASIGGVALRSFKITMDYVNQRATFEKP